jgi:hypothetical protein
MRGWPFPPKARTCEARRNRGAAGVAASRNVVERRIVARPLADGVHEWVEKADSFSIGGSLFVDESEKACPPRRCEAGSTDTSRTRPAGAPEVVGVRFGGNIGKVAVLRGASVLTGDNWRLITRNRIIGTLVARCDAVAAVAPPSAAADPACFGGPSSARACRGQVRAANVGYILAEPRPTPIAEICALVAGSHKKVLPLGVELREFLFVRGGIAVADAEGKTHLLGNVVGRIGIEYVDVGVAGGVFINNQNRRTRSHRDDLLDVDRFFAIVAVAGTGSASSAQQFDHNRDIEWLIDCGEISLDVGHVPLAELSQCEGLSAAG